MPSEITVCFIIAESYFWRSCYGVVQGPGYLSGIWKVWVVALAEFRERIMGHIYKNWHTKIMLVNCFIFLSGYEIESQLMPIHDICTFRRICLICVWPICCSE